MICFIQELLYVLAKEQWDFRANITLLHQKGVVVVKRTKQAIVEGFNRLIARKDFNQITAQDIMREADVSKATFYRYFKDKYDVMNYNYKCVLDEALSTEGINNYRDLYKRLYDMGKDRLSAINRAFGSTGANSFERYIYEYSKDIVEKITRDARNGVGLNETEELQLDVFCYGISFMYKNWINNRYNISADEAADCLFEMMPATLRTYWFSEN